MSLTLTDSQKVALSVSFVDKKGNPAPVEGAPAWSVSDDTLLGLTVADDGTASVAAVGPLGTAQVTVSADADLGEGVTTIFGTLDIDVIAGAAVTANIAAGAPEEQ